MGSCDLPEARSDAERVRRNQADVRGGARARAGRVLERRLDERATLSVVAALACLQEAEATKM